MLQARCGLNFTVDACCLDRDNSFCEQFYTCNQSFLESDVSSQHTWLHAPYSQLARFVAHYKFCKDLSPSTTSACIFVPCHLVSQLSARGLLSGMQLLHTFMKGSQIFTGNSREIPPPRLEFPAHVYFDPPSALLNSVLRDPSAVHLHTNARIAGVPVQLLFDTGASDNFISADFVHRMGFSKTVLSSPQHLTYANGDSAPVQGEMSTSSLKLDGRTFKAQFLVAPLIEKFDIILGRAWLTSHCAVWDFPAQTLSLKASPLSQLTIVHMSRPVAPASCPLASRLILPKQVRKEQARGATLFSVTVEPVVEAQSQVINEQAQPILREFTDVFAEPPAGLPPERIGADHTIDLIPGSEPPFKQMYRLSKSERLAVEKEISELLEKGYIEPSCFLSGPLFYLCIKRMAHSG
jgi:hypothetical protein